MAAKRLKMNRLKEILRLSLERGLSQRKVARALRVGNGTVSEYLGRARAAGVGWPLPAELEDEERLEAAVLGAAKAGLRVGGGLPDAVPERSSGSARRKSARRTAAETCLRPVACGGTLAWARAARGLRVKREPRRVRVAERGPGVRGKPSRQGGRGCGG